MSYSAFACKSIGVAGTTPVVVKRLREKERTMGLTHGDLRRPAFEARMGVALLGSTNMSPEEIEATGSDPFDEEFHDNYVRGFGQTEEEAIEAMKRDQAAMAETLFI